MPIDISQGWVDINMNNASFTMTEDIRVVDNIVFENKNQFFEFGDDGIVFDGNNYIIDINGITGDLYEGVFRNGYYDFNTQTFTKGKKNTIIKNLGITNTNSILASYGGWIGQKGYSNDACNNLIENCYSTGEINLYGGGIVGGFSAWDASASLLINNCYTTGEIKGSSGGIVGIFSTARNGKIIVENSYHIGDLNGSGSGGIFSEVKNSNGGVGGTAIVKKCYVKGDIYNTSNPQGNTTGGLFAENCNGVSIIAQDSYFEGNIINEVTTSFAYAPGGIFGANANGVQVINCYAKGNVSGTGTGGIFGNSCSNSSVINSYVSGTITGTNASAFDSFNGVSNTKTNTYAANGTWNQIDAYNNLNNGTIYQYNSINGPGSNDIYINLYPKPYLLYWQYTYVPSYESLANIETNFKVNQLDISSIFLPVRFALTDYANTNYDVSNVDFNNIFGVKRATGDIISVNTNYKVNNVDLSGIISPFVDLGYTISYVTTTLTSFLVIGPTYYYLFYPWFNRTTSILDDYSIIDQYIDQLNQEFVYFLYFINTTTNDYYLRYKDNEGNNQTIIVPVSYSPVIKYAITNLP